MKRENINAIRMAQGKSGLEKLEKKGKGHDNI